MASEGDDRNDSRSRGVVLYVPGPLEWLLNKWNTYLITAKDPSFKVEEFIAGAKQALCVICQNVSADNYGYLEELMNESAIEKIRNLVSEWTVSEKSRLEFNTKDILLATPRKIRTGQVMSDYNGVEIDMFFVVICRYQEKNVFLEFGIEFQKSFSSTFSSDWITSGVNQLRVKHV